jgi:hypothetical protein
LLSSDYSYLSLKGLDNTRMAVANFITVVDAGLEAGWLVLSMHLLLQGEYQFLLLGSRLDYVFAFLHSVHSRLRRARPGHGKYF